ncbi:conjugal transfer protein [Nocardia sp. NPDC127579]|uniref:conjugal transfer protein n=1 Tax=Nocardia sp. NPDC127579 TaxID=3345402 RepID=UPI0036437374
MRRVVNGQGDSGGELLRRMAARRRRDNIMVAVLAVLAVLGGGHAILDLFRSDPPGPSEESTTAIVGRAQLAGAFAEQFVLTYLSAVAGQQDRIGEYTGAGQRVTLPTTARQVSDPIVVHVSREVSSGTLDVWAVTVSVVVGKTGTKVAPSRQFYRVGVTIAEGTWRALSLPAVVQPPSRGIELATGYPSPCGTETVLAQVASGFLAAFLTGSGEVGRYSTVDAGLTALHPAPYTALESVAIVADDRSCGAEGAQARVLATVNPKGEAEAAPTLAYPLTMVRSGDGQWQVRSIDSVPALANPLVAVAEQDPRGTGPSSTPSPTSSAAQIPPATQN